MKNVPAMIIRFKATWQPFLAGALLCVLVGVVVGNLNNNEEDNLRNEIRTEVENLAGHINSDLRNRFSVLQRMAKRWDVQKTVSRKEFTDNALEYISYNPGFQALEWADRNFIVRWVVPVQGNKQVQNLNLAFEDNRRLALEKARDTQSPSGTMPVDLVQGGKGFLVFFPVHVRDRFEGIVAAVFRVDEWVKYAFSFKEFEIRDKLVLSLELDGVLIYRQAGWNDSRNAEYDTTVDTLVLDRRLTLHARPTAAFISKSRTVLPKLIAVFGFLVSILLTYNLYLLGERKKTADELNETLSRIQLLLDSTAEAIYGIDLQGNCTFVNPSCLRMLGYQNIGQLLGKNMHDLIHHSYPDGRPMPVDECRIYRAFRERTGIHSDEEAFFRSDGTSFPVEYWSYPQIENGVVRGAVVTFNDITERREAEDKLRAGEERLRNITESAGDAIIMMDSRGIISFWNPAAENIFGYTSDEAIGKDLHSLIAPDRYTEEYRTSFSEFQRTGHGGAVGTTRDLFARLKNGQEIPIALSMSALWQDGAWHAVGIVRDVTVQKQAEAALQEAKKMAEAANLAKSDFLSTMSHEIRTPMNAIIGMAELLAETSLTQEQARYVEVFRSAGENLLSILNDILDLSKIEAGRIDIESVAFDLDEIVGKACQVMAMRAAQKELEFACHILPDVPVELIGDPVRLRQIIVNLLGNAIKFTEQGEVLLEIRNDLYRRERDSAALLFLVRDTGIGIPADKIDTVFEKFSQADSSTTRKYGGTGLGLPISRRLVQLMGGDLSVKSEPGKGTEFSFTLSFPVQTGSTERKERDGVFNVHGMKALIIDDNETNRMVVKEMLSGWGFNVSEAEGGNTGVGMLQAALSSGSPYDLVVLDNLMPDIDGISVALQISDDASLNDVPVIMLTSDPALTISRRMTGQGIAACISKPVRRTELKEAVSKALDRGSGGARQAGSADSGSGREKEPLKILLVDDSEDNRLLVRSFLKQYPYTIEIGQNGLEAVERFKAGKYNIVLMDMQMPVMDGYTATKEIRAWESQSGLERTPIIALTAYALQEEIQKSMDAGCDAHLTKPVKKATLIETIGAYARI
jgi:two-component system, sensor histidine kinase and response regulator